MMVHFELLIDAAITADAVITSTAIPTTKTSISSDKSTILLN